MSMTQHICGLRNLSRAPRTHRLTLPFGDRRQFFICGLFGVGQQIGAAENIERRPYSNMPKPILYFTPASPPCRSVALAAAALGIDMEIRDVNLLAGDHLTPEFRKLNPEHTVPTLDDNGFVIWESHAIMCYLVDTYGKDDSLYPKDLRKRAYVNQRLYFDASVLFPRLRFITYPLITGKTNSVPDEKLELLDEAFQHLNGFLEGQKWLAGDSYTLADISCVTTITNEQCFLSIDKYPNIIEWIKRCEESLPGYAAHNTPGAKIFHKIMGSFITSKGKL